MKVLSPDEMREVDRFAIDEMGVSGFGLMERAGSAVGRVVHDRIGIAGRRIVVLAGKGNNGGDGLVAARYLASRGASVEVFLFAAVSDLRGDAARALGGIGTLPILLHEVPGEERDRFAAGRIGASDILIDALLGTGSSGAPRGRMAGAIRLAAGARAAVVAVDAPSGVNAATGLVEGEAIRADLTVTLCRPKQGLYLYPGRAYAGEIVVAPIGMPREAIERSGAQTALFVDEEAAALLPRRPRDAHKGRFGRIVVAGGSPFYIGAPLLAGKAALRSGAGLVSLGVPASLSHLFAGRVPELMTLPLADREGAHTGEGARLLLDRPGRIDVLAAGPGFSRGEDQTAFVHELLSRWKHPLVLDADAIHALAGLEAEIARSEAAIVLTPHLGEMEALTGVPREEILADRIGFVRRRAEALRCVLLLKGNPTLVAAPDGSVSIHTAGNPGMATAGSGDVLTGVIAAFLGQGLAPYDAARLGVSVHGHAGDIAARGKGEAGVIAGDLIDALPPVLLSLEGAR